MRIQSVLIYVLVIALAAPAVMARQTQTPPDVWRAYSERLDPGAYIRIQLKDHRKVKGYFVLATADTLRLRPKTRVPVPIRDFQFVDIESIDRQREGWSPGAKVLTGLAVGVGAVLVVVAAVVSTLD